MPAIETIGQQIAWSYANLARAHAALNDRVTRYEQVHHIIRNRTYHGLITGKISMRSIFDDERLKMTLPQICVYCGSREKLAIDHMIPKLVGGADDADNLVLACRACNSSKQGRDMLRWLIGRDSFPSIFVLRRYIKVTAARCASLQIMDDLLTTLPERNLPFAIELLPDKFPALETLTLWVRPQPVDVAAR